MTVGTLAYVVNDALIRRSTEEGLGVYQSLFLRGCLMVVIFGGWAWRAGHRPSDLRADGPTRRRVGAEVIATACFFAAIVRLEFANAQTILMVVPFLVTLVAARRLGEVVDARRYAFIAVGFVGVVAVVRPLPAQFSAWSLLVVVAALLLVVREFATRHIDPTIPPVVVALQTALAITSMTGVLSIVTGWGQLNRHRARPARRRLWLPHRRLPLRCPGSADRRPQRVSPVPVHCSRRCWWSGCPVRQAPTP